jgi:hypothetical protein
MDNYKDFSSHSHRHSEKNGHHFEWMDEEDSLEEENTLLTDELDHEVLMHRDCHFAGDFKVMLDYYMEDHIGINTDFEIERIQYLAQVEHELGKDLAPYILTGVEAEKVAKARAAYRNLKAIYEFDDHKKLFPRLIADLILSEEEEPIEEVNAVVNQGKKIIPELLQIIESEDAYDPLFPGYGFAPFLAIQCLGKIKDPQSIIPLFECFGKNIIFDEEVILEAFYEIGDPAKQFLLKTLAGRPITQDNVNASYALTAFPGEDVSLASFRLLQDPQVREKPLFAQYLLCNCEQMTDLDLRQQFISLSQDETLPRELKNEMKKIIQEWGLNPSK